MEDVEDISDDVLFPHGQSRSDEAAEVPTLDILALWERIKENYRLSVTKEEFDQKFTRARAHRIALYLIEQRYNLDLIDDTVHTEISERIKLLFDYEAFTED
jgi:hypothetical protein